MKAPFFSTLCVTFLAVLIPAKADEAKADKEQPLHEISLEVQALQQFDSLKLTPEQLALLAKLSKETADPERKRTKPKVSEAYERLLKEVRNALNSQDDDKAEALGEELEELKKKESPEIDDDFQTTKAARQRASEVLQSFKPSQLAAYYGDIAQDMHDPLLRLQDSLTAVRGMGKDEWRGKRDEIADEVAWLTVGTDVVKWQKVLDQTVALLDKSRSLNDSDFKKQHTDLDKAAKEIVGDVGPDAALRHYVEWALADLLSNPRLEAAVKVRLK